MMPSSQEVLENFWPAAVRLKLYQCFLDAAVCAELSRLAAMRSPTENATI